MFYFKQKDNIAVFGLFLQIVKKLNKIGIIPIVYGSLGLYISIGERGKINDIDLILKNKDFKKTWNDIISIMSNFGYKIDPDHCEEFIGKTPYVSFSDISGMKDVTGIIKKFIRIKTSDAEFLNLSLKKYLSIYENGLNNKWRRMKKEKDDLLKISYIKDELAEIVTKQKM